MFKTKKKTKLLIAPATGNVIPLENSEDEAFAQKLVGDGIALMPVEGDFRCPADGRIAGVAEALHAYSLETEDGVDILIHIGIDTVELMGEGYKPCVKAGDMVKAGDPLCKVDIDFIKKSGYSVCTPVVICDMEKVSQFSPLYGEVIGGADACVEYSPRKS